MYRIDAVLTLAVALGLVLAGRYTFRHTFRDNGGTLAVDLEVLRGEEVLFETTHSTSFDVANKVGGNEYVWLTFVTDGLQLPIDEHRLLH